MRDALNGNLFEIKKIHTGHNGSNMLMKSLPREKLGVCCSIARMVSPSTIKNGEICWAFPHVEGLT